MAGFFAHFITMFEEPIASYVNSSIIARARSAKILETSITSVLAHLNFNHHAADDTPYGGGPGELLRIDVIAPLIEKALAQRGGAREKKRVILLDPAGTPFTQHDARRLASYEELVFISGRYEGIDARVHYYIDETISLGDFVLTSGDLAACAIFDATARMIPGVLGNFNSIANESHDHGRLEASHYTRPQSFEGHDVPKVFLSGNHEAIKKVRAQESLHKTKKIRPDLLLTHPPSEGERQLLEEPASLDYPWIRHD